jgi:hypothetical protein
MTRPTYRRRKGGARTLGTAHVRPHPGTPNPGILSAQDLRRLVAEMVD